MYISQLQMLISILLRFLQATYTLYSVSSKKDKRTYLINIILTAWFICWNIFVFTLRFFIMPITFETFFTMIISQRQSTRGTHMIADSFKAVNYAYKHHKWNALFPPRLSVSLQNICTLKCKYFYKNKKWWTFGYHNVQR